MTTRQLAAGALALGLIVASLLQSAARAAGPRYALTQLSTISTATGMYANAYDINDSGVIVGSESRLVQAKPTDVPRMDWTVTRPLQWSAGSTTSTLLPTLSGYGSEAYAINNGGVAVGASASTAGTFPALRATVFRLGTATLIPGHTAGNSSVASDINDAGRVVGTDSALPFAYDTTTSTDVPLNRNNTYWGAEAINESGVIVANGGSPNNADARPARLSTTATPAFLYSGSNRGTALDLNEAGVAVGQYDTGSFSYRPAIFRNGSVQTLTVDGIASAGATAINDRGRVVGWTRTYAGVVDTFVYENGVLTSLTSLVNGLPAGLRLTPNAINNRGQIVGQSTFDHDNNASTPMILGAFRLDPIRTLGDTNYDDRVDFADLLTLAKNYNKSGNGTVFWESGDFNYDWIVNFEDLLTLAKRYNATAAGTASLTDGDIAASFAVDWSLAQSLVPEPASLMAAGAVWTCLGRRRRRTSSAGMTVLFAGV